MKVFLLEDAKVIGEKICTTLKVYFENCEVVWEQTIENAEKRLEVYSPDIAIVDLHLPDGFGLEFAEKIKRTYPSLKICIFTNLDIPYMRQKALDLRIDYYIDKTKGLDYLLEILRLMNV